jgi:hypothetical protein
MNYQQTKDAQGSIRSDIIIGTDDSGIQRWIPSDSGSADWQAYQAWCAAGNQPALPPALTPEEATAAAWSVLRAKRNALLASCDWTQMPDNQLDATTHANWELYRQALRALPEQTTDPTQPAWPTPPGAFSG